MRSPGYVKCLDWLKDIWESLENELIKLSFIYCGIKKYIIDWNNPNFTIPVDVNQLHTVLKYMIYNKEVVNTYVDDDLQLLELNNYCDENDEEIFHFILNECSEGDVLQVESPENDETSENEEMLDNEVMNQIQTDLDNNEITTYQPSNMTLRSVSQRLNFNSLACEKIPNQETVFPVIHLTTIPNTSSSIPNTSSSIPNTSSSITIKKKGRQKGLKINPRIINFSFFKKILT